MKNIEKADYYNIEDRIEDLIHESKTANVVESVMFVMAAVVLWVVTFLVREFAGVEMETVCVLLSLTASTLAFGQVEHTMKLFRIVND